MKCEQAMNLFHATDCYYCICRACSMFMCPRAREMAVLCYKSCWQEGRRFPRLDCDYFTMKKYPKRYRFNRKNSTRTVKYTVKEVGEMFENILEKLGGDYQAPKKNAFTVLYDGSPIGKFDSFEAAEAWANNFFSRKELVKIERSGEDVTDN